MYFSGLLLPLLEPWSIVYMGPTASGARVPWFALWALVLPETTSSYLIISNHTTLWQIKSAGISPLVLCPSSLYPVMIIPCVYASVNPGVLHPLPTTSMTITFPLYSSSRLRPCPCPEGTSSPGSGQ